MTRRVLGWFLVLVVFPVCGLVGGYLAMKPIWAQPSFYIVGGLLLTSVLSLFVGLALAGSEGRMPPPKIPKLQMGKETPDADAEWRRRVGKVAPPPPTKKEIEAAIEAARRVQVKKRK